MSATMTQLEVGQFVTDGRAEAQITDISPDGFMVEMQYTDTNKTVRRQRNRFERQSGELHVI